MQGTATPAVTLMMKLLEALENLFPPMRIDVPSSEVGALTKLPVLSAAEKVEASGISTLTGRSTPAH